MEEQDLTNRVDNLYKDVKEYLDLKYRFIKLEATEKTVKALSSIVFLIVILFLVSIVFLFLALALAFYLGRVWNDNYLGFTTVAGIFMFLALLLFIFRKSLIINPIQHNIIESIFNPEKDE